MALISRYLVLRKLVAAFPDPTVAEQALESLDRYGKPPLGADSYTVYLAIIKLSGGKLWRLRELVQEARRDFRNVLYPAQAPEQFRSRTAGKRKPADYWWAPVRPKKLPAAKDASLEKKEIAKQLAMQKRDQKQWIYWLTS